MLFWRGLKFIYIAQRRMAACARWGGEKTSSALRAPKERVVDYSVEKEEFFRLVFSPLFQISSLDSQIHPEEFPFSPLFLPFQLSLTLVAMRTSTRSRLALAIAALLAAATANVALAASAKEASNEAERASTRPQPSRFATLITPDPDYEPLM